MGRRVPGGALHEQLVPVVAADPGDAAPCGCAVGAATTRTRCGHTAVRDQAARRPAAGAPRGASGWPPGDPGGAGPTARARARKVVTTGSGLAQPRRVAGGMVTTTPRSGWMVTRSRVARGERRRVNGRSPPGSRASAGVSVAAPAGPAGAAIAAGWTIRGIVPARQLTRDHPAGPAATVRPRRRRTPCAILPLRRGAIAQLGERLNGIQKVKGSNPFSSTNTPLTPTT